MLDINEFPCTGCSACYNVCPHQAIQMTADKKGFLYPQIDAAKCTDCGLCEKVCPSLNGYLGRDFSPLVYGAKNKHLEERKQSQSGGVFYLLAKEILSKGGVVYGAETDEALVVRHGRADTEADVRAFRGSKYVQSNLTDTFARVKADLQTGKEVLFSGTPCQVAGLRSFLRKDYENLLLVDLICHGVASPKLLTDYKKWQSKRLKGAVKRVEFRDRALPWGKSAEAVYVNGEKKNFDVLARIYASANAYRDSCYVCPFASDKKISDITIGDFWGIEDVKADFKDDYGVSAVLVNSKKGKRAWENLSENVESFPCALQEVLRRNPNLHKPSARPKTCCTFWQDYEKGFSYITKKYGGNNFKTKLKKIIKRFLIRR